MKTTSAIVTLAAGVLAMCVAGCNTPGVSHEVRIHDGHHGDYQGGRRMHEEREADEVKVSFEQLPQAVKDTLAREAPGVVVTEAEQEMKHGVTTYEVDAMIGDTNYELKIAADGKLISKKENKQEREKGMHEKHDMGEHGAKGHMDHEGDGD